MLNYSFVGNMATFLLNFRIIYVTSRFFPQKVIPKYVIKNSYPKTLNRDRKSV
jgi:hypothetical protein